MESDIIRSCERNGRGEIVVDVRFANSLYAHLVKKGMPLSRLEDATFVETSYRIEYGKVVRKAVVRDKAFEAKVTLYEFEVAFADWEPKAEDLPDPQVI